MPSSDAKSYAAQAASSPLAPFAIERREPGAADVEIDILFCGWTRLLKQDVKYRLVIDMATLK